MPTLCASYTKQHLLNPQHLAEKGIFAVLTCDDNQISFLNPLMFVGLMGVPDGSSVVLPVDVGVAFHQLGNCISVQHALTAICIGLVAASVTSVNIRDTVIRSFQNRIKAETCHVFHNGKFIWISSDANVCRDLVRAWNRDEQLNGRFSVDDDLLPVDLDEPICGMFAHFGWDSNQLNQFMCFNGDSGIPMGTKLRDLVGIRLRIICRGSLIIQGDVLVHGCDEVNPTIEDVPPSDDHYLIGGEVVDLVSDEERTEMSFEMNFDEWDACPANTVTIFHYPHRDPTFLMCQTVSLVKEVQEAVTRSANQHVQVHEMKDVPGFSSDLCVLAVAHQVPQTKVCVVWVDAVKKFAKAEVIDKHKFDIPFIQDGHCFMKQSPRELLALQKGAQLGSDECEWLSGQVNGMPHDAVIHSPIIIDSSMPVIGSVIEDVLINLWKNKPSECNVLFPVLQNEHWAGVDIQFGDHIVFSLIGFQNKATANAIRDQIREVASRMGIPVSGCHCLCESKQNMCGWLLIHGWLERQNITFPTLCEDPSLDDLVQESFKKVDGLGEVMMVASRIRTGFLNTSPSIDAFVAFGGGTENDEEMDPPDPLQSCDPWLKGAKAGQAKNARWEDLRLPSDHQFCDEKGSQLQQVTRQQLAMNRPGIAFVTRANIAAVLASPPVETAAILVPLTDASHFSKIHPKPKVDGPIEITVSDQIAQTVYKRQAMLVHVSQTPKIKEVKGDYKSTLTELREIVFELDSRVASRETLSQLQGNPHDVLKSRIQELFPPAALGGSVMYGYKKIVKNDNHCIYQILAKVTNANRATILEHSCLGEVSSRDFIQKGEFPTDHTILPRFWEVSRAGREDALRTATKVDGVAGIIIAKRGIAVRSWNNKLAKTRAAIMVGDSRLCGANLGTVPRHQIESSGWPSHITAVEIVKACQHYTQMAPVPSKAYRSAGITYWTLLFSEVPPLQKFVCIFNAKPYEILLVKTQEYQAIQGRKAKPSDAETRKGKGKGNGKSAPPSQPQESEIQSDRLTTLENKFNMMEKKQHALESKVDSSFASVNDQLRQILQAVCPREQSQGATGCTPPPKQSKTMP